MRLKVENENDREEKRSDQFNELRSYPATKKVRAKIERRDDKALDSADDIWKSGLVVKYVAYVVVIGLLVSMLAVSNVNDEEQATTRGFFTREGGPRKKKPE